MNKNLKISTVAGIILYGLAAVFSISLLLVLFDAGGFNPAAGTFLYRLGKMFTGVYGFCSVLIPLFLLVAAFQCFTAKWHTRNGVLLAGSVIPFFTLDAIEHVCRMFAANTSGDALAMKIGTTLLTGAIIVAVEYLVLSILGDAIEGIGSEKSDSTEVKKVSKAQLKAAQAAEEKKAKEEAEKAEAEKLEKAVVEDAIVLNEKRNDLKALKARLAERRQSLMLEEAEQKPAETEAEVEAAPAETVEAVTETVSEDNPFAHVFDSQDEQSEIPAAEEPAEIEEKELEIDVSDIPVDEEIPEETLSEEEIDTTELDEVIAQADETIAEANDSDDFEEAAAVSSDFEDFDYPSEMADAGEEIEEDTDDSSYEIPETAPIITDESADEISDINLDDFDVIDDFENTSMNETEAVFAEEAEEEEEIPVVEADAADEEIIETAEVIEEEEEEAEDDLEDDSSDSFGDDTFSSEIDGGEDELNEFVESRNSSFESIFAQMDNDAAESPVESEGSDFEDDFGSIFEDAELEKGVEKELSEDLTVKDDYEFDPMADPIVDANGMPFGPPVPFDIEDTSFEEVINAKKTSKPLSFAEKAVFLQDSDVPAKKAEPEAELPPASKKVAVDAKGKPVVDFEKIEKKKPKLRMSNYKIPVEGILTTYENGEYWVIDDETKQKAADLKQTLSEFNIEVEITGIRKGPVVTMFEVLPAPGVNVNRIRNLQDNIALRLAATSVRIVSPIPGKSAVGIEIPNKSRAVVSFREIMEQKNPAFDKMNIPVILGKDISGEPQIIDLAKTPHLLIAGSTGAGKSVCVNSLILSILYKRNPQQVKLILVDPKVVELKLYNDIPHLLTPVITEPKKALQSLQYCLCEMERRYALLDNMGVRDINSYNRRIEERNLMQEKLPYIVVIIDEFADLMATTGKELESNVARLAAMSRAVGIHLVLATQRPSVNVITGLIKANIPSRIAFMVASRTDSTIIIDQIGAEKLLGKGDMLYASATDPFPVRIQGTLVSDDEVEKTVEYVKQYGEPDYIDDEIFVEDDDEGEGNPGIFSDGEDALYDQALQIVLQSGKASASYLQRRLKIGYNRAARLVEEMEERGIVGPANGSKPREVIYVP